MSDDLSRRDALRRLGLLLGAVAAPGGAIVSRPVKAAELPHLTTQDPTARALAYHDDAKTVDPREFPSYKAGQKCSTCQQIQGQKGQHWRPCTLFPDALVNADGWCRAWTPGGGPD
jgi:hypothetical protein